MLKVLSIVKNIICRVCMNVLLTRRLHLRERSVETHLCVWKEMGEDSFHLFSMS